MSLLIESDHAAREVLVAVVATAAVAEVVATYLGQARDGRRRTQRVITTGPYRWVRHPAYAANLLTYGGLGLALGSWVSATVVLTAAFVGLLPRIKLEERTLEQAFGPAYVDYEHATARLIPRLW